MKIKKIDQETFEIKIDREELNNIHQCIDTEIKLTENAFGNIEEEEENNLQKYIEQLKDIYKIIDDQLNQDLQNNKRE